MKYTFWTAVGRLPPNFNTLYYGEAYEHELSAQINLQKKCTKHCIFYFNTLFCLEIGIRMITLQDISFSYQDSTETLFDGFSATLGGSSRWTCIAGANGCGKTTLLKLIAGMLPPLSGTITCDSAVYCKQSSMEMPDTAYALFWDADNETRRFFSLLGIAAEQLDRWETLSGGEKKRLQIACALAEHPAVLLLDEPTNHLDTASKELIIHALKQFTGTGLIVSHDRAFADALCTATLYLYRESAVFAGGADAIRGKLYPAHLSAALKLWDGERASCLSEWHKADADVTKAKVLSDMWHREAERSEKRLKNPKDGKDHDAKARTVLALLSGKNSIPGKVKKRFDSRREQAEKRRNAQAKPLKLLILDEPTNHLDILSIRLLENALAELSCAFIIISHDSVFLQNCNCMEIWQLSRTGNCGTLTRMGS